MGTNHTPWDSKKSFAFFRDLSTGQLKDEVDDSVGRL